MGKITKHAWFYNFSLTILQFVTSSWQTPSSLWRLPPLCVSSRSPPPEAFHACMLHVVPAGRLFLAAVYLKWRESRRQGERLFPPCRSLPLPGRPQLLLIPIDCTQPLHGLLRSCVVIVLCSAGSWTVNYLQGRIWGIFTFAVWSLITTQNVFVGKREHEIRYIDIIFNSFIEEWCLLLSLILLYFSFFSSYSCSIL